MQQTRQQSAKKLHQLLHLVCSDMAFVHKIAFESESSPDQTLDYPEQLKQMLQKTSSLSTALRHDIKKFSPTDLQNEFSPEKPQTNATTQSDQKNETDFHNQPIRMTNTTQHVQST